MTKIIEYRCECEACQGSGIYKGMAEKGVAGVVCNTCKGKGYCDKRIEYNVFTQRKIRQDVEVVFECNPGITIGFSSICQGMKDFGGMLYIDWLAGIQFAKHSEMRNYTCPRWWCQIAGKEMKLWEECVWGRMFSQCDYFPTKDKCWQRFDKEQEETNDK